MPKKKLFFDNGGFYSQHDFAKSRNNISVNQQKKMQKAKNNSRELNGHEKISGENINTGINRFVINKNKHQNETSTRNSFDTSFEDLEFINEYLINNKRLKGNKEILNNKPSYMEVNAESIAVQHDIDDKPCNEEHDRKVKKRKPSSIDDESDVPEHKSVKEDHLKKKKEKHKNKSSNEDESDVVHLNTIEESVKKKKKRHKNKSASKECNDETIAFQQITDVESFVETPTKKKKKKHKYNLSPKSGEDVVVQHSIIEESVEEHMKNRNVIDNLAVHVIKVEVVDQEPITEKTNRHENVSINVGDESTQMEHNTNEESENVHVIGKKKHKRKSSCLERKDESTTVQHVINGESDEGSLKKKKKSHKYDLSPKNSEDIVGQRSIIEESVEEHTKNRNIDNFVVSVIKVETINEEFIKEKKKMHGNQSMNEEGSYVDEGIEIENNVNVESEKVEQVKEKKKHKHKSTCLERKDESTAVQHVINEKSYEELLKKKKRRHKYNLSPQSDEDVVVQHSTIEESVEEHIKNRNFIDNIAVPVIKVETVDEEPTKEKKKRHENKSMNVRDESIEMEHNTNVESEKVEQVIEKKNKHKSTYPDRKDNVESDEEPLKKNKKSCKSKLSFREVEDESLVVQHNIIEESVKKHVKENNINHLYRKNSDKDERESSNSMLYLSDEELFDVGTSVQFIVPNNLDFGEEPVEFEVPLLHSCENVKQISEEEREALKSKGVIFKLGKFSETENSLLKRNFENFARRFGVNDPQVLLGLGQKYRNKEIVTFLKAKHFYVRLGKDLNDRPLYNIYKKARLLFDTKHKKLSPIKVVHLKKAHTHLGNKWQEIGNKIDRSGNTTRSAFYWHDKPVNLGNWTAKEEDELVKAIMTVLDVTNLYETEFTGISWEEVANLVPRRNFHQCRLYWFENLSRKFKETVWHKKDYSKLVSILSRQCYVEDYAQVDWKEVEKCFGGPGWHLLRKKWYALKKKLPRKNMTYKQMLHFLYAQYKHDIENSEIEEGNIL